jgi:DNA-binding NarL/FixJ family response regulator
VQIRCLLVDDNEAFLASATRLLRSEDFDVAGTATTAADAVHLALELKPDVAVVDVELGGASGFDVARALAGHQPPVPTIMISMYPEADLSDLISESPALGFLSKSELSAAAIRRLLSP